MVNEKSSRLIRFVTPDFIFEDDRGRLDQLFSNQGEWSQANVVFSKANVFRGGHYHKNNQEMFYVIKGSFRLTVEQKTEGEKEVHDMHAGDMFIVPPFLIHSFDFLEETYLVAFYDKGVEEEGDRKDIYNHDA